MIIITGEQKKCGPTINPQHSTIKPDGILTTKIKNQVYVTEIFFDHKSKKSFQDKLIKAVFSDHIS